jgi:RND family efflux transporter MFP subunit
MAAALCPSGRGYRGPGLVLLAWIGLSHAAPAQPPNGQSLNTPSRAATTRTAMTQPATTQRAISDAAGGETAAGGAAVRAQLVPMRYTALSGEVGARIERLGVREGDRFRAGQTLVVLDCGLQRAQLAEAQAALAGAEKTRGVTRRMVELQSGGVLEADVAAAEAAKMQARVESAQALLAKCSIAAPYQGRVVEQKVREFQFIQPGQVVFEILDDSALEVEFIAPSAWLAWLRPGDVFSLDVDELSRRFPARVTRIGARVDAVSHSVKVVGEIVGPIDHLMAGMSGRVTIDEQP